MSTSPNTQNLNNPLSTFPIHLLHLSPDSHPFIQETSIHYSTPTPWCTTNTDAPPSPCPHLAWGSRGGGGGGGGGVEGVGGSGAIVQTEVNRKWLLSLARRSWPQHRSTFHFSLCPSMHSLLGHVAQHQSLTFTLSPPHWLVRPAAALTTLTT